jgi:hypothetical protein
LYRFSDVPPTLVTQGCDGGSSTLTILRLLVPRQSKAPSSPDALSMLWPCSAICSKIRFSACASATPACCSHSP